MLCWNEMFGCLTLLLTFIFSPPLLKASVSFSDHFLSSARLSVRLSVRLSIRSSICLSVRLSVWISSLHSRRLLQKHWTNFSCTQHHWVKRIKVVKMKGHTLFQGGYKWLKIIGNLLIFFKNVLLKYQLEMKFVLKHPQVVWIECELKFVQIYDPRGSEEGTGDRM